jgi:hypothetical protein
MGRVKLDFPMECKHHTVIDMRNLVRSLFLTILGMLLVLLYSKKNQKTLEQYLKL